MTGVRGLHSRFGELYRETLKFGAVGGFGVVVNVVVFNLCLNQFHLASVRSSIISTAVAILTNYLGNRYWAFRHRASDAHRSREMALFLFFSGVGMAIEAGAVALSHYGFGFTSALSDNIAKYAFGLPLGTLFRFWSYRRWVFTGRAVPSPGEAHPVTDGGAPDLDAEGRRLLDEETTRSRG